MSNRQPDMYSSMSRADIEILLERAHALSKEEDRMESQTDTRFIVAFTLNKKGYAIDVACVREILPAPPVTAIPYVPEFILGAVNLRGNIVTITDLEAFLGIAARDANVSGYRLMVLQNEILTTGILVEEVAECTGIAFASVEKPLVTVEENKLEHLLGEIRLNGKLYAYLNMGAILKDKRLIVE